MLVTGICSIQRERRVITSLTVPSPQLLQAEAILTRWLQLE